MWKKILLAVLVAGGVSAALIANRVKQVAVRPVERGTFIAAPPATIVTEIARLQNWVTWSGEKDDPAIRRVYGGPPSGTGATCYWSNGNRSVEGRMTVISVRPDSVELEVELVAPKESLTDYTFQVTPEGSGSRLLWSASGDGDNLIGKALGAVEKRDKRVGTELENGLAGLKKVVEAQENMQAYRVERSITIAAPDVFVLAEIMDFREWSKWVPREKLDPDLKRTFSGSDAQPGSTYFWSGNDETGVGRVSMISSSAEKVELEVELEKPIDSTSDLVFTLVPEGAETRVVWTISGEKNASGEALTLLGSSPQTLAGEMERGLANLKAIAEGAVPGKASSGTRKSGGHAKPVMTIVADSIVLSTGT